MYYHLYLCAICTIIYITYLNSIIKNEIAKENYTASYNCTYIKIYLYFTAVHLDSRFKNVYTISS